MSVLHGFLYPKREEKREFYLSGRFQGENGEPLLWEIRPISAEEDLGLRQSVETGSGMDYRRYLLKLAAFSTVTPDLKSEELQDAYSAYGEEELLSRMLLPGELARLIEQVEDINGFTEPMEELVDQAKK
ncbi:MAG: phage portal protein [Clostridiales bacterium]|nr:phage portal protein [Clostridiales bacterium]